MRKKTQSRMTFAKPRWLTSVVGAIACAGLAALVLVVRGDTKTASAVGNVAVVVTLLVLVIYTYYTGLYAKAAVYASVSFELRSPKADYFQFLITNHSGVPVKCWCSLNPAYEGTALRFGGPGDEGSFYEGGSAFDVLARQTVNGALYQLQIFFMGERSPLWAEILARRNEGGVPRITFAVEFWYEAEDFGFRSATIVHRYYYDFAIQRMVLDY